MTFGAGTFQPDGYRADGLRAWKQPASGGKTYFLYDGGNPVVEMNSSGTVTNVNVYAPDGLVARKEGSTWSYYTFDMQGNVINKLSSSEAVTSGRLLDAWGQGVETVLPITIDPFGYNAKWGYYYDRETQLYLCQHRMYDASAGRWLNRDPIGYAGGVNLYGYCAGGPVGSADSSGKMPRNIIDGFLKMERCAQLLEQIREMQGELTKRFYDMFNDPKSLFPFDPNPNPQYPGSGTWSGHQGQYRAKQIYLQRLLEEYSKLGCGNGRPPRNAHKQSRRPAPDHPGQPVPYLMEGCEGYDPSAPMSDMPTSFPTAAYPTFRSDVFDNLGAPSFTPLPAPTFGPLPIPIPI